MDPIKKNPNQGLGLAQSPSLGPNIQQNSHCYNSKLFQLQQYFFNRNYSGTFKVN